jgi:hypothetical protein
MDIRALFSMWSQLLLGGLASRFSRLSASIKLMLQVKDMDGTISSISILLRINMVEESYEKLSSTHNPSDCVVFNSPSGRYWTILEKQI